HSSPSRAGILAHAAGQERARRNEVADHAEEDVQEARPEREDAGREVRETATSDHELERARHARLAAEGQAPGAVVRGEGLPRAVALPERPDCRFHRELGATERGVDSLARERVEEPRGTAHEEDAADARRVDLVG